jgi:hypothetical protein
MRIIPTDPDIGDSALIEAFRNHLVSRDLAPGTIRAYLHDLKVFQDWLAWVHETPAAGIAQASTVDLAAFRKHLLSMRMDNKASCLSLLSNAILIYTAVHIGNVLAQAEATDTLFSPGTIAHVSPLQHSHVIVNGTYDFSAA